MEIYPTMWITLALVIVVLLLGGVGVYLLRVPQRAVALAGGTLAHRQLATGRLVRRYDTYVPGELVPDAPLVIVLHGARQDPQAIRALVGGALEHQARLCGFAVAYPAAHQGYWDDGYTQAHYRARVLDRDDSGFIEGLITAMSAEHAVDPQRVYVLGYCTGGQMAYRLALEMAQQLAGVAVIAAGLAAEDNLEVAATDLPIPMLIVNGTADRITPFEGGATGLLGQHDHGTVRSAQASAQHFAALAGADQYQAEEQPAHASAKLTPLRTTWSNAHGPAVVLYAVQGGGHVLHQPYARQPRWLGSMNPGFDVAACACRFWGL